MVLKFLLSASAGILLATPALATPFTLAPPDSTGPGDYNFTVFDKATGAGTFTDTFAFTIPADSGLNLDAALINIAEPTSSGNINFLSAVLSGPSLSKSLDVYNVGNLSTVSNATPISILAGESYLLTITYSAAAKNDSFSGNITTAAVPELATWGMLLVGVGAIGATLRGRQRLDKRVAVG